MGNLFLLSITSFGTRTSILFSQNLICIEGFAGLKTDIYVIYRLSPISEAGDQPNGNLLTSKFAMGCHLLIHSQTIDQETSQKRCSSQFGLINHTKSEWNLFSLWTCLECSNMFSLFRRKLSLITQIPAFYFIV